MSELEDMLARAARMASDGKYKQSLTLYESACEAAPRDERGHCGRLLALLLIGKLSEVEKRAKELIEIFGAVYPHGIRGAIREEVGDFPASLACYDDAIKADPSDAAAYVRKAHILQDSGFEKECAWEIAECASACDPALETPQGQERLREIFGNVRAQRPPGLRSADFGAFVPGLRILLDKAVGDGLPAQEYPDLDAIMLAGAEERAEAIGMADSVLAEDPESIDVLCLKARILESDGRMAEAMACNDRAIEANPGSMAAYGHKLSLLYDTGDRAKVLECLEAALGTVPNEGEAWIQESLRGWHSMLVRSKWVRYQENSLSVAVEWHLGRRRKPATGRPRREAGERSGWVRKAG